MAALLACSSTHMRHNVPVALSRTSGQPATSPTPMPHMHKQRASNISLKLYQHQTSNRGVLLARASANSDNVRELASEKAVESGKEVADDTSKLANGQSSAAFDATAEDASDSASYNSDVRASVTDVAADMAVDPADVDDRAKKDAEPLAQQYGRSVDDTAGALESKAEEVADREGKKETYKPRRISEFLSNN